MRCTVLDMTAPRVSGSAMSLSRGRSRKGSHCDRTQMAMMRATYNRWLESVMILAMSAGCVSRRPRKECGGNVRPI